MEIDQKDFIGKPLKTLLDQIGPQIKSALGNPGDTSAWLPTNITFYFVNKNEYYMRKKKGEDPIRIMVYLKKPDGAKYPKLSPEGPWTDEQTNIYGNMIINKISVLGDN